MQNITPEMWKLLFVGFVVGILFTYIFVRFVSGSAKQQAKKDHEIKKMQKELELQRHNLAQHFSENAQLMHTLAQDYQKLYEHFMKNQQLLLPKHKDNVFMPSVKGKNGDNKDGNNIAKNLPPKDYSEGPSGLFKN